MLTSGVIGCGEGTLEESCSGFQAEGEVSAKMQKTEKAWHTPGCVGPERRARGAEGRAGSGMWRHNTTSAPYQPGKPDPQQDTEVLVGTELGPVGCRDGTDRTAVFKMLSLPLTSA